MKQHKKTLLIFLILNCCIALVATGQTSIETSSFDRSNSILRELLDPSSSKVFIAAHRGGYENDVKDKAPENSFVNIKNCQSKGYEIFETDIQRTKDGHFVMVHDQTIRRETSGEGTVSDMTLLELKSLHKRYRDRSLSRVRVATLPEFLDGGKGRTVFKADMKRGVSTHFAELMKLVTVHDALDGIIFRVPYREVDLYQKFREQGVVLAKHTLMFQVSSRAQIDDIKARFNSSTIEIELDEADPASEAAIDLIRYAADEGFVVETHADGEEDDWVKLIKAGVRIFHTKAPLKLKKMLGNSKSAATVQPIKS